MLNAFVLCWAFGAIAILASIAFFVGGNNEAGNMLYVASFIPATIWLASASAKIRPKKGYLIELVAMLVFCASAITLIAPETWIGPDNLYALEPIASFAWLISYAVIATRVGLKIHSSGEEEGSKFWSVAFVFLWPITAFSVQRKVKVVSRRFSQNSPD